MNAFEHDDEELKFDEDQLRADITAAASDLGNLDAKKLAALRQDFWARRLKLTSRRIEVTRGRRESLEEQAVDARREMKATAKRRDAVKEQLLADARAGGSCPEGLPGYEQCPPGIRQQWEQRVLDNSPAWHAVLTDVRRTENLAARTRRLADHESERLALVESQAVAELHSLLS